MTITITTGKHDLVWAPTPSRETDQGQKRIVTSCKTKYLAWPPLFVRVWHPQKNYALTLAGIYWKEKILKKSIIPVLLIFCYNAIHFLFYTSHFLIFNWWICGTKSYFVMNIYECLIHYLLWSTDLHDSKYYILLQILLKFYQRKPILPTHEYLKIVYSTTIMDGSKNNSIVNYIYSLNEDKYI